MEQQNKQTIRQLFEQVINERRFSALPAYVAKEYTGPTGLKGPEGFEAPIAPLVRAFPDIRWQVLDLIAENDQVVLKWRWTGTQTGDYRHIPAINKTITSDAIAMYRLKDGKIVESQLLTDRLGFLQALGQLPEDVADIKPFIPGEIRFIDGFTVPAAAKKAFLERVHINRTFIRTLPGFLDDAMYGHTDDNGHFKCMTIARWKDAASLQAAKSAVQQAYAREGFDPKAFMEQHGIRMERGKYEALDFSSVK